MQLAIATRFFRNAIFQLAEAVGLEPTNAETPPVFKTGPSSSRMASQSCVDTIGRTTGMREPDSNQHINVQSVASCH